ncbi:ATPase associated with various cellular activities AAA_3 [Allomuricauda ruestringensis DSM 13258]|uniref:ATPase associated with various cellular activities AAA_3 n=1 Tax=Allomuricauda ruestringensis (strain DSM 13258 / CIP 107369 / LMG 19739 / B1) TaxID=886377 RepID=G2PJ63_ALLRU|nr:MoxR family ATPase [Allomuricauda ruestringensis]AEM71884.1 ATPase associated with various cellular activities AAA_3 [Allomuricauda ruestringensis DSM 13258]
MDKELQQIAIEVEGLSEKLTALKKEIGKVIIGQEETVSQLLITFLAGGHALLEGVPGLAKTLMIRTLSNAIDLKFKRIQFTPDLMPSDIIGTEILEEDHTTGKKFFKFNKGPIFSNIILADEINRTPPKTQAALLEAMQEFEVTYGDKTYALDKPFFILATQNPIEQSGTFVLPEAQQDRFLLYIKIGYPTDEEETQILKATTGTKKAQLNKVLSGEDIVRLQQLVREVSISDGLIQYVSDVIRATRPDTTSVDYVKKWVDWGAGPRAGQAMILTAKANTLLEGRLAVTPEDLQKVALPVLRHRVLVNFRADAEGITSDTVTKEILKAVQLKDK